MVKVSKKNKLFTGNILKSDLLLACLLRACSLVWLEHPADNREVTGSNPVVPTKIHHFLCFSVIRSIMKGLPFPVLKCQF